MSFWGVQPNNNHGARSVCGHRAYTGRGCTELVATRTVAPAVLTLPHTGRLASVSRPLRLSLPVPDGPYPVGNVALRCTDPRRPDPWVPAQGPRELMFSVWYPARQAPGYPVARQMSPAAAASYERTRARDSLGVPPGTVDWAQTRTNARHGAPVELAGGPRPVVLYSPGAGEPRTWGTVLAEELASRGYIVITTDHTYESSEVQFPRGRVRRGLLAGRPVSGASPALLEKIDLVRQRDIRFVLDRLTELGRGALGLPDGLLRALDLDRVGMFGPGAGGRATLGTMHADRRVKAGVTMDGGLCYGRFDDGSDIAPVAKSGLDRPFLLLGGQPAEPAAQRRVSWELLCDNSSGWRRELYLRGGTGSSFSDGQALLPQIAQHVRLPAGVVPGIEPRRAIAATKAYLSAFFDRWLRGANSPLLDGPSARYPDILFGQ